MFCLCVCFFFFTSPPPLITLLSQCSLSSTKWTEMNWQTFFLAQLTNQPWHGEWSSTKKTKTEQNKKTKQTKEITTWINFKQAPWSFSLVAQNCTGTHIIYIFKINRANLAKSRWAGQFCLLWQHRETQQQPFIRTAFLPLSKPSSQSPFHTDTHTHSRTHSHTHSLTRAQPHTPMLPPPPPPCTCTKPEGLKKGKGTSAEQNIIKHTNAIFSSNASYEGHEAKRLDRFHRISVWKELGGAL